MEKNSLCSTVFPVPVSKCDVNHVNRIKNIRHDLETNLVYDEQDNLIGKVVKREDGMLFIEQLPNNTMY